MIENTYNNIIALPPATVPIQARKSAKAMRKTNRKNNFDNISILYIIIITIEHVIMEIADEACIKVIPISYDDVIFTNLLQFETNFNRSHQLYITK